MKVELFHRVELPFSEKYKYIILRKNTVKENTIKLKVYR